MAEKLCAVMCVVLNIADTIVILALDTADCLPISIPAKWLTLLRCHCIPDRSRAQLRSTPEYGQTTENRYKLTSLLKGVLAVIQLSGPKCVYITRTRGNSRRRVLEKRGTTMWRSKLTMRADEGA